MNQFPGVKMTLPSADGSRQGTFGFQRRVIRPPTIATDSPAAGAARTRYHGTIATDANVDRTVATSQTDLIRHDVLDVLDFLHDRRIEKAERGPATGVCRGPPTATASGPLDAAPMPIPRTGPGNGAFTLASRRSVLQFQRSARVLALPVHDERVHPTREEDLSFVGRHVVLDHLPLVDVEHRDDLFLRQVQEQEPSARGRNDLPDRSQAQFNPRRP